MPYTNTIARDEYLDINNKKKVPERPIHRQVARIVRGVYKSIINDLRDLSAVLGVIIPTKTEERFAMEGIVQMVINDIELDGDKWKNRHGSFLIDNYMSKQTQFHELKRQAILQEKGERLFSDNPSLQSVISFLACRCRDNWKHCITRIEEQGTEIAYEEHCSVCPEMAIWNMISLDIGERIDPTDPPSFEEWQTECFKSD